MLALLQIICQFVSKLLRFFFIGDTWASRIIRIVSFVVALVLGYTLDETAKLRCTFASGADIERDVRVGTLALWCLGLFWLIFGLGVTWCSCWGSVVCLGDELEADREYARYRLRLAVKLGSLAPGAFVTQVVNAVGNAVVSPVRLPLELEPMHQPKGERQRLCDGLSASVSVVQAWTLPEAGAQVAVPFLLLTGMHHQEPIERDVPWEAKQKVWVRIHIAGAVGRTSRWFSLEPDKSVTGLFYKARSGLPPYLSAQESWLSRCQALSTKLVERGVQQAKRFIERMEQHRRR